LQQLHIGDRWIDGWMDGCRHYACQYDENVFGSDIPYIERNECKSYRGLLSQLILSSRHFFFRKLKSLVAQLSICGVCLEKVNLKVRPSRESLSTIAGYRISGAVIVAIV